MTASFRTALACAALLGAVAAAGVSARAATPAAALDLALREGLVEKTSPPPWAPAWGYRRKQIGPDEYYYPRRRYYGNDLYSCHTVWRRAWDPYAGTYVSRPVRRCW